MINDVRRAYFYARATRDIYIEIPPEDPDASPQVLGKLKLCLYGTRDAPKGWQEELSAHLVKIGFKRGVGHPSVFHHPERNHPECAPCEDQVCRVTYVGSTANCRRHMRSKPKKWEWIKAWIGREKCSIG